MRILVTGSRTWSDIRTIADALKLTIADDPIAADRVAAFLELPAGTPPPDLSHITLVHGDCPDGADVIADGLGPILGVSVERHPAKWDQYGRAAGPVRNQLMVDLGADICLAFIKAGSKGAAGCAALAEKAGIPVRRYEDD